jgi:hypothetical protein
LHAGTLSVVGLALIAGHASRPGHAAEEAALPVVVPLDTGDKATASPVVYVPQALWERLSERRHEAVNQQPWMIERADYVGRLSAPAATGPPPALTATYQVRTAAPAPRVRLDFGSPVGPFRPLDALLDGRLIALTWDGAGRACTFEVPTAGVHALELQLRPTVRADTTRGDTARTDTGRADGASWQLEHPLPPVAAAYANLALPAADAASAELLSAVGSVARSDRVLRGEIGPADRLVMRWSSSTGASQPTKAEVDELLWLRIKAGAVSLRAKWVFDVHRGQARQFHLAADRRLRLNGDFRDGDGLKIRHEGEPLPAPRTLVGPQVFKVLLDSPRSGRFSVECEFTVEDTHGIGQLRYPQVKVVGVPIDRRRLAVSWDPDLKVEEIVPQGKTRASVGEFLAVWGDRDGQPSLVRDGGEVRAAWALAVRQRDLNRAVQQTLWVDFGPRRAEVRFQADVTSTAAPCFHHRVLLPADLVVERLTVSEGNQTREAAWTVAAGAVNVFLGDKAAGAQRIELAGYVPIAASGAVAVPGIQLDEAVTTSAETRIYRQPTMRVSVDPGKASKKPPSATVPRSAASEAASSNSTDGYASGRLVGAFLTPPGTALRVKLQPNRPRARAPILITILRKDADAWVAEATYDALVSGELDALTWAAPAGLGSPVAVDPPGQLQRQAGGDRARWRYVPDTPLTGASRVTLSWRLPAAAAQRVDVPHIDVVTTAPVARLVALPQALTAAEAWEAEGLVRGNSLDELLMSVRPKEPKDKPAEDRWARLRKSLEGYDLYRAAAPGAAASLRRLAAGQGRVWATEAAVQCRFTTDTAYHALARFNLMTEASASVNIRLPEGCHLVRCAWAADAAGPSSAGLELPLPASQAADDESVWQVNLGPQPMPRVLEVVIAGNLAAPIADEAHLQSPMLVDVPVGETNWTVTLPPGWTSPDSDAQTEVVQGRPVITLAVTGAESHVLPLAVRIPSRESLAQRVVVLVLLLAAGSGLASLIARLRKRRRERLTPAPDLPLL